MTRQARAGAATGAAESMARGWVQRGVPEGAEQLRPRVRVGQDSEGVQRPQGAAEGSGGRGRGGPDAHVGVVGQGQVGWEGVGQVAGGGRVAHHVGVERRVRRVRPGHGQALPFVLHPPVLEPHLQREGRPQPSPAAAAHLPAPCVAEPWDRSPWPRRHRRQPPLPEGID